MDTTVPGLIATKLLLPVGPRHYVRRPRLDRQLAAGIHHRLTLIAAPAGFGKTSLVTGWMAASQDQRVSWLSLEAAENDPTRFWAYFCGALERLGVVIPAVDDVVSRSQTDPPEIALTSLVNAIATLSIESVLVLDDYHVINDPRVHAGMAFLINQLPPRFHLVLLTRADPPFINTRWKANGDMVEIRARDLSFNHDETDLFLTDSGVDLPPDLQEALIGRLSGWVAALRLASNWIAGRDDIASAVAEFTASDSTIAAYLTSEVLDQLAPDVRDFVLGTAILPQLSAPLCDAVMERADSATVLEHLYLHDLFVDALDTEHEWFRYHHLFAELLAHQLRREHPERERDFRLRAAAWYADNGFPEAAIDQGIAAKDWDSVKLLLLREVLAIGTRFQPVVVGRWLAQVPTAVRETPFFLLLRCFVSTHEGNLEEGRDLLRRGLGALADGSEPELPELSALLNLLGAGIARLDCDIDAVLAYAQAVRDDLARVNSTESMLGQMAIAAADNSILGAAYWCGAPYGAERLTDDDDNTPHELLRMRINRTSLKAAALAETGQLRRARVVVTEVLDLARSAGLSSMFQTNPAHVAAGLIALQRIEHDRAFDELSLVWDRARRQGDRGPAIVAAVMLARLAGLAGDVMGGIERLDAARTVWPGWTPPDTLQAMIAESESRLSLAMGDVAAARAVLARLDALRHDTPRMNFTIKLMAARIMVAEGIDGAAPEFLECADIALSNERLARGIEALVEAALAYRLAGDDDAAGAVLGRAMSLAEVESIAAPFVWHAAVLRPMLLTMEQGVDGVALIGFRQRLLDAMGVPSPRTATTGVGPIEALSERELTVLRLLRGTLTNPEIAQALDISPNTLKTHLRHIYAKLDAGNRRNAVDRAQSLHLL